MKTWRHCAALGDSQLMWRSGRPTSSIISLSNPQEKTDFNSIQIKWQASQITRDNGAVMPSCAGFAAWYIHLFIEGANLSISLVPVRICVYKRTDLCFFHAIQILSSAQSLCSVACLLTLVPQHVALPPTREDWEVKLLQHVKWSRHYNTCNSSELATHCGHVRKGSCGRRREEIATECKHRCRKLMEILQGIVQPKMTILSSFTHSHILSNLYDFLFSVEYVH